MCMAVGLRVEKLKRVKIGNLGIDGIEIGKYVLMNEKKIKNNILR